MATKNAELDFSRQPRPTSLRYRQKRSQVARACDGCRAHRIKCDNNFPCSNCESRGRHCSNDGTARTSTLSQAHDEIARLKKRVEELEAELQRGQDKQYPHQQATPSDSSSSDLANLESHDPKSAPQKVHWQGIAIRPTRSPNETWYGASSLYYYIHRLSTYLSSTSRETSSANSMLPASANTGKLLGRSANEPEDTVRSLKLSADGSTSDGVYLSPIQEGYFISLFWETYHTSVLPIINEAHFKEHYQSLWAESGATRRPSALVDIVVAIAMQVGIAALPSDQQGALAADADATIAGRWHYRRGQMLLSLEAESPTLSTLQCHLLCICYLCGGSFHNMVDMACSLSVRTAQILGLHVESSDMPEPERQLRRRLWWAVYLVDSKVGMKLGRPFLLRDDYAMPEMPSDRFDAANTSGSTFTPLGQNATWLSFNLEMTKLYMKVRQAHTAFYGKETCAHTSQGIWDDDQVLEEYARLLSSHTNGLDQWATLVPAELKTKRRTGGKPFFDDGSFLEVEHFSPAWVQRQRVLLELTYHHLCVNLYRPFISFAARPVMDSEAQRVATRCAVHAISFSNIAHQILSTTPILNGWLETFQGQWSSAMTLIGFVLMYPHGPMVSVARAGIDHSIAVFDIFGASFSVAAEAARITRELCNKVDAIVAQRRPRHDTLPSSLDPIFPTSDADTNSICGNVVIDHGLMSLDAVDSAFSIQNNLDGLGPGLFDMALDIEFWADLDMLWPQAEIPTVP
ncbi:hypothetical protein PFICI_12002 [Pestalotiopsis fici W106-1]|uniref:Zn(2)-C6 fungal-type domain-containing protein n=1 Tax=Pestalotiopsis fici (strain W106-1 / CGMCC3.15140) TaxID=1229662 RepID=W3WRX8_PESFW|nr:uncharacterized protein PFICI_12002 [Pestalotiopsis fici W106-1]ETS76615.1 hypothetical protein PFICI_12002 [Pestalotiopsis fici W106-1]